MSGLRTPRVAALAVLALAASVLTTTAAPAAAAATTYTITDLGSLGYGVSDGLAVNNNGQVTGYSFNGATVPTPGCCGNCYGGKRKPCMAHIFHAFLYSNGTMADLGTLGGNYSQGNAINLSGQVAGWANTKTGAHDAASWTGKTVVDLGALAPLAGWESTASGINDAGQVVGWWGFNPTAHAWLYSNGTITDLPEPSYATAPGASGCVASAIDNNGQILGGCDDASSTEHAVLWQNGAVTDLSALTGLQGFDATAISSLGKIAGSAPTGTGAYHEFLYSNGTVTDLGHSFITTAVNDDGVIAGTDQMFSGGTLQNLNNLIPAGSPYQIQYANAINDNGQIAADGYDTATYQGHALLLTPH